jgi:tubulin polyglutamylase TTLL9
VATLCLEAGELSLPPPPPCTQGGKKFDLRIFALVLSYAPLKIYLYREGFARFTNTTYSLDKEDLSNASVHLTNHAVQKKDAEYDA